MTMSLEEEETGTQTCTAGRPCEDSGRRQPSASQGERPQDKPTLLTPSFQTSNHQNREKIKFCCLNHSACGTLLWPPQRTNILYNYKICGFCFMPFKYTGNYIQYFVITYMGKESEKECVCVCIYIYIYKLNLCGTPETNSTL